MKKLFALFLVLVMLMTAVFSIAESALSDQAQLIFDAIRWNLNLPKSSTLLRAEEYLFKASKEVTLHTLLMEVTLSEDLEAMYGTYGRIMLIDLDSGTIIDYKTLDNEVCWPESGELTNHDEALHLLYNGYLSWLEGWNENIMSMHEFITPVEQSDIDAINAALTEVFVRPAI